MQNNSPEYLDNLQDWLSSAQWHTMLTLSNKSNFPPEWFFAKLEKLVNVFDQSFHVKMEWAASIELTRNGLNHCHALIRFPQVSTTWLYGNSCLCGSIVFPKDWQERQKTPRMIKYVFDKASNKTIRCSNDPEALKAIRQCPVDPFTFLTLWYQCNYGAIAQCEPIRKQDSVVKYALKYATKEITSQSLRWNISSGAVPSMGS